MLSSECSFVFLSSCRTGCKWKGDDTYLAINLKTPRLNLTQQPRPNWAFLEHTIGNYEKVQKIFSHFAGRESRFKDAEVYHKKCFWFSVTTWNFFFQSCSFLLSVLLSWTMPGCISHRAAGDVLFPCLQHLYFPILIIFPRGSQQQHQPSPP